MNELISEFFYDGIRRMIPGLLALALYPNLLPGMSQALKSYTTVASICILLGAWVIGVILEVMTFAPFALLLIYLSPRSKRCLRLRHFWLRDSGKNVRPSQTEDREVRRQFYKLSAEKIMCRCLGVICLPTVIMSPQPIWGIAWHWCYGPVGIIIFATAWWWINVVEREADARTAATPAQPEEKKAVTPASHKDMIR